MARNLIAAVLMLLLAVARAEPEGVVQVPGAYAEIGWQGEFSLGGWVEFRLVANGADQYRAVLETSEGKVRQGLVPVTAELKVDSGIGVREARMLLPILSTRLVKISLFSPTTRASQRFEPKSQALTLEPTRVPRDPGLYLAGHTITSPLEATSALPALAGGAVVQHVPVGLRQGFWGLGAVATVHQPISLFAALAEFAPQVSPPERRHPVLGLWVGAVFVLALFVYNLMHNDWRIVAGLALVCVGLGVAGLWAQQPNTTVLEKKKNILIGAGGWGLRWEVVSRFSLPSTWELPAGALLLEKNRRIARNYTTQNTTLSLAGWQQVSYVLPPKASRLPIRLEGNTLVNESKTPLEQIFVRGVGRQEPMQAGSRRTIKTNIYETLPWDEYIELAHILPDGAVMAKQNDTLLVALGDGR